MNPISLFIANSIIGTIQHDIDKRIQDRYQNILQRRAKKYSLCFHSSAIAKCVDIYHQNYDINFKQSEDIVTLSKHRDSLHKISTKRRHLKHLSSKIQEVKQKTIKQNCGASRCSFSGKSRLVKLATDPDEPNQTLYEKLRRKKYKLDLMNKKFSQQENFQCTITAPIYSTCPTKRPNFTTDYDGNIMVLVKTQGQQCTINRAKDGTIKNHRNIVKPNVKITNKEKQIEEQKKQNVQAINLISSRHSQKYDVLQILNESLKSSARTTINGKNNFAKMVSTCRIFSRKNIKKRSVRASIDQIKDNVVQQQIKSNKIFTKQSFR